MLLKSIKNTDLERDFSVIYKVWRMIYYIYGLIMCEWSLLNI